MRKKNALTKKQLDVIDDLFTGELDEQAVLEKHNVNARLYSKWQADDVFVEQFEIRIAAAHRQSAAMIARYAPVAAAKLVQLTQSEKEETARKACLDIIAMQAPAVAPPKPQSPDPDKPGQPQNLTPKTAARILAILAEEQKTQDNNQL